MDGSRSMGKWRRGMLGVADLQLSRSSAVFRREVAERDPADRTARTTSSGTPSSQYRGDSIRVPDPVSGKGPAHVGDPDECRCTGQQVSAAYKAIACSG